MSDIIAQNSKAHFHYEILETFEVGIILKGSEVKSVREGKISLQEAWVQVLDGELWLKGLLIPTYKQASFDIPDPVRARKLLAHKHQIGEMEQAIERKGMTVIVLKIYFDKGRLKVLIALAKGKSKVDKREDIKAQEDKRYMERAMKTKNEYKR